MKKYLGAFALCLVCLLSCISTTSAEEIIARPLQEQILSFLHGQAGVSTTQELINSSLSAQAGTGAEWYILCLAQSGDYDFSVYEQALLSYLDSNTVTSATTKQKYALVLAAIGSTDAYISQTLDSTLGALGIMSYAYGLHMVTGGYTAPLSADQITDEILALQKQDGGWAVSGNASDADVTAMVLQALAPYYGAREDVTAAADRALSLLSARQTDAGGYKSYGVENPESAAQVIVALCALDINPETDPRFIKNGNTAFDAIARFALAEGGYAHTAGGGYNAAATAQVFCAATAYLRFTNARTPLYDLDRARPDEVQASPQPEADTDTQAAPPTSTPNDSLPYKPIACATVLVLGVIGGIVLVACKKRHYKNFIALGLAVVLLITAILLIDIRTPEDYYNGQTVTKHNPIGTVTLTIRCDAVPNLDKIDHLPDDGIVLATEAFEIEEGESVYDILVEAARKHGLHLDATGAGDAVYVRGIGHLYEQQHGELSGWNYMVNGQNPSMGCAAYTLSDGDRIVWEYTLTIGK